MCDKTALKAHIPDASMVNLAVSLFGLESTAC